MPKLSIITINYNDDAGLEKTLESIFSQIFDDYESIVIDGGSTDNSVDVIKKYADKIKYWVSENDRGIYQAQNKGIEKAAGTYCLFLNSGDYLVDEQVLLKVFANNFSSDIIYGDLVIDHGNGTITHGKMPEQISFLHMYSDTLWHPVSFIKRDLFNKLGMYDEQFKMVADYDFFFRAIIINNATTRYVPVEITVYNLLGFSSKPENKIIEKTERLAVLNKYLPQQIVTYLTENIVLVESANKSFFKRIANRLKLWEQKFSSH